VLLERTLDISHERFSGDIVSIIICRYVYNIGHRFWSRQPLILQDITGLLSEADLGQMVT